MVGCVLLSIWAVGRAEEDSKDVGKEKVILNLVPKSPQETAIFKMSPTADMLRPKAFLVRNKIPFLTSPANTHFLSSSLWSNQ